MKSQARIVMRLGFIAAILGVISCGNGNDFAISSPNPNASQASDITSLSSLPRIELDLFSRDELFAAGGGGCGMTLLPKSGELPEVSNPAGMLLFHGTDSPMLMKINQKIVEFELEDSQGEALYGQKTQQTFRNAELNLIVDIQVNLGESGAVESAAIPNATVKLQRDADSQEVDAIAIFSEVGC